MQTQDVSTDLIICGRKFGAKPEGEFIAISEARPTKIAVRFLELKGAELKGADTFSMNNRASCCGVL
jgi:hypothetical protein